MTSVARPAGAPKGCEGQRLTHCWHDATEDGRERTCCHCGAHQRLKDVLGKPDGHGPHAPPVFAQEWRDA